MQWQETFKGSCTLTVGRIHVTREERTSWQLVVAVRANLRIIDLEHSPSSGRGQSTRACCAQRMGKMRELVSQGMLSRTLLSVSNPMHAVLQFCLSADVYQVRQRMRAGRLLCSGSDGGRVQVAFALQATNILHQPCYRSAYRVSVELS